MIEQEGSEKRDLPFVFYFAVCFVLAMVLTVNVWLARDLHSRGLLTWEWAKFTVVGGDRPIP